MTLNLPESSFINPPHEVEGTPKEARASFYELAKDKIKYLTKEETEKWISKVAEPEIPIKTGAAIMRARKTKDFKKWVKNLEIIVNKDAFNRDRKDYSDLIPFVVEHEIYEAWLTAKKGVGFELGLDKQHLLARRRQYLLAEQAGLGDKIFEWHMKANPSQKEEYEYALRYAKKQLGHLESKSEGGEK